MEAYYHHHGCLFERAGTLDTQLHEAFSDTSLQVPHCPPKIPTRNNQRQNVHNSRINKKRDFEFKNQNKKGVFDVVSQTMDNLQAYY